MGRKITDGLAVDVVAPAGTFDKGELYRIDGWTGIAMISIAAADTDRVLALECSKALWRVKVPAATAVARGDYLGWTTALGTKSGATDLAAIAAPAAGGVPATAVAKVEAVRNSTGYATIRVLDGA
jgi:hypothetical protein